MSKEFNNFLREEDITRQLSVEYTPQQNGIAEQANRTLMEMSRCIMLGKFSKVNIGGDTKHGSSETEALQRVWIE